MARFLAMAALVMAAQPASRLVHVAHVAAHEERIKLRYRAVPDVRVLFLMQHRHGHREQASSHRMPRPPAANAHTYLAYSFCPPVPRSVTILLAPSPMHRHLFSTCNALVRFALNIDEETAPGQEVVLIDAWPRVDRAHIVRKRAPPRVRWRTAHVRARDREGVGERERGSAGGVPRCRKGAQTPLIYPVDRLHTSPAVYRGLPW